MDASDNYETQGINNENQSVSINCVSSSPSVDHISNDELVGNTINPQLSPYDLERMDNNHDETFDSDSIEKVVVDPYPLGEDGVELRLETNKIHEVFGSSLSSSNST